MKRKLKARDDQIAASYAQVRKLEESLAIKEEHVRLLESSLSGTPKVVAATTKNNRQQKKTKKI